MPAGRRRERLGSGLPARFKDRILGRTVCLGIISSCNRRRPSPASFRPRSPNRKLRLRSTRSPHGRERSAMERQRPEPAQRVEMARCCITLVAFEPVSGVKARLLCHERVARHFGHDRRRRDRRAQSVAIDNPRLRKLAARNATLPIDQNMIRSHQQRGDRSPTGLHRGPVDVYPIYFLCLSAPQPDCNRIAGDCREQRLALLRGEQLGICQSLDSRAWKRIKAAAITGPARAPTPTSSTPATGEAALMGICPSQLLRPASLASTAIRRCRTFSASSRRWVSSSMRALTCIPSASMRVLS
jgi:hypothetical protein